MNEHGLYKFIERNSGEIIYIGKTNSSFKQRINSHLRGSGVDQKFLNYKDKCDIYIALLPNSTETDILEKVLINKYKPILNNIDNHLGISNYIQIGDINWIPYELYSPTKTISNITKIDKDILLWENCGTKVYLVNSYECKEHGRKIVKNMYSNKKEALKLLHKILFLCNCNGEIKNDLIVVKGYISPIILEHFGMINKLGYWDLIRLEKGSHHKTIHLTTYFEKSEDNKLEVHFRKDTIFLLFKYLGLNEIKRG